MWAELFYIRGIVERINFGYQIFNINRMISDIQYLNFTVGYSSVGPGWSDGRGGGNGRSGMSLLQLGKICCFIQIDFKCYHICQEKIFCFQTWFSSFLICGVDYGWYSQISVAEAGFCFSQEVIMDVVLADVVTGICVALADDLKIKQPQLEYQGPLKVDLW